MKTQINKTSSPPISKQQQIFLKKQRKKHRKIRFLQIGLLFFLILGWEIAADTGAIQAFIFSSPSRIVNCFFVMLKEYALLHHMGITVLETLLSFLLVSTISILLAIILWWFPTCSKVLEPYFVVLNSLPKSALAPILIVWLGNNMKTIIIAAISVAIFGSILSTLSAFVSVEGERLKLIKTLGGNKWDCLRLVVIPSCIPAILNILKVNIGLCLVGVVIGEFLAAKSGLGYLIIYGSQVFKLDFVMLSIFLLCLLAMILYFSLQGVEKHFKGHF